HGRSPPRAKYSLSSIANYRKYIGGSCPNIACLPSPTFLLTARYLSQEPAGSHARCKLEGISLSRHFLLPNYFRQVCGCCLTPLLADRMRIDPKCCAYDVAFHERPPDLVFVRQRAELLKSPLGRVLTRTTPAMCQLQAPGTGC